MTGTKARPAVSLFRHSMPRRITTLLLISLLGPASLRPAIAAADPSDQMQRMLRDAAVVLLKEGNIRFAADHSIHPNATSARRAGTAKDGQEPLVTVLSCADSRVPVERVFDRGVGEIFSIRVAGNVADTDEIATIEYGVGHLHTPVLVVLGHTQCGAVTAMAKGAELHGLLPALLDNIKPAVDRAREKFIEEHELIPEAIRENVWQAIADTVRRSSVVREQIQKKALHVLGAVYNIETGKVEWLGEHPEIGAIVSAWSAGNTHDPDPDLAAAVHTVAPVPDHTPPSIPHAPPAKQSAPPVKAEVKPPVSGKAPAH